MIESMLKAAGDFGYRFGSSFETNFSPHYLGTLMKSEILALHDVIREKAPKTSRTSLNNYSNYFE